MRILVVCDEQQEQEQEEESRILGARMLMMMIATSKFSAIVARSPTASLKLATCFSS